MKIIKGRILYFLNNPFIAKIEDSVNILENGGILIEGNLIKDVDEFQNLKRKFPHLEIHDYGNNLITAGFIDCHMHYPQTKIIASYGKRLLDWLNDYTFPEEIKFENSDYAKKIANLTLDLCLRNGTTTVASFCTTSVNSVDAIFEEAEKRKMCVVAGKTCMDRNAPKLLIDNVKSSYDDSKSLIKKWHLKDRNIYAITPRFAPTSSPEQLETLGNLWTEYPDCIMQTHLSEQKEEIKWVKQLFPKIKSYLEIYQKFNLVKKNSIFGHCIYLQKREIDILREIKSSVAHCPTSNTFIGSGIFDLVKFINNNIDVGLATDTGGGTSFSMLKTMSETYKISQLNNFSIHPAQLLWLATVGSSKSLGLENKIGNIIKGNYADLVVIELNSTKEIEQRQRNAESFWEALFPTLLMGDDRAIISTWVSGKKIS
ncbi:guanine deaminase [SAR116 cluster bacterium]|nr:guanine deaminase [SAR116 cluster bacterium]